MNIDDLLAEMDSAMNDTPKTRSKPVAVATTSVRPPAPSKPVVEQPLAAPPSSDLSDIDSLLQSASLVTDGLAKQPSVKHQLATKSSRPSFTEAAPATQSSLFSMSASCSPLILHALQPKQTGSLAATCSHIHCIQCSHSVIQLPGRRWANVDYFFFRNAMPNIQQLETGTIDAPCSSAYCCQCAWINIDTETNVASAQSSGRKPYHQEREATPQQIKWICAKTAKF